MNTRTALITAVLILTAEFTTAASTTAAPVVVDRLVAVVNDEIITLSDLQRELAKHPEITSEPLMLEEMIDRKLQMAIARRTGVEVTDKELSDAVADVLKRNSMDTVQFEAALAKEGMTLVQYRTELREQMTLSRLFNKYVRAGLAIDEAEVRDYYERNRAEFSLPEEVRVRLLFLKRSSTATAAQQAAVRERAAELFRRAAGGEEFTGLIKKYSESPTASQDGDLGFLQRGHAIPEIDTAAAPLKPGEFAGPIETKDGFYIIRMEEIRTPVLPLEKVKDRISKTLYEQKVENTYRTWLQALRTEAHIENRL